MSFTISELRELQDNALSELSQINACIYQRRTDINKIKWIARQIESIKNIILESDYKYEANRIDYPYFWSVVGALTDIQKNDMEYHNKVNFYNVARVHRLRELEDDIILLQACLNSLESYDKFKKDNSK